MYKDYIIIMQQVYVVEEKEKKDQWVHMSKPDVEGSHGLFQAYKIL